MLTIRASSHRRRHHSRRHHHRAVAAEKTLGQSSVGLLGAAWQLLLSYFYGVDDNKVQVQGRAH